MAKAYHRALDVQVLIEQVNVGAGRTLDLGCGTGTLTIMLKRRVPRR